MELFREEPLIKWPFTDAILFTAYDVYRSNDFWIDSIVSSGSTLKEGLVELGFPKTKTLLADTGIFEVEARKAGIARDLGIQVDVELSNSQIFEAYELSGADYFVSPDEIVLPNEDIERIQKKIITIKQNLLDLLEIVHPSKIIAVIQGHTEKIIDDLFEFYRRNEVSHFAIGGVLPLYHQNKTTLEFVLKYVRAITNGFWLHVFGLPHMGLLRYYLHEIRIDSVDTTALLYITARKQYLIGSHPEPVREAVFEKCGCDGCQNLKPEMSTTSSEFFLNLYIHNLRAAAELSKKREKIINRPDCIKSNKGIRALIDTKKTQVAGDATKPGFTSGWMTAQTVYELKMEREKKRLSYEYESPSKPDEDAKDE